MKTATMSAKERRIENAKKVRNSQVCFCGRFKWRGFSFCNRCRSLLHDALKRQLIGEIDDRFCRALNRCREYLKVVGVREFEENGKL